MMLLKRSCIVATTLLMGMAFTHQAVAAIAQIELVSFLMVPKNRLV